jgi:hypothetical protein
MADELAALSAVVDNDPWRGESCERGDVRRRGETGTEVDDESSALPWLMEVMLG